MTVTMPTTVTAYFQAANGADPEPVAACFALDATVHDEGADYVGRVAIRDWVAAGSLKYSFQATPTSSLQEDGKTVVTAHLTGDFPGAPTDLTYRFGLTGNEIASLDIS